VARVIALARLFDFDHVGAHVSQHLGTPGASEHAREIQDFEVGEGGSDLGHGDGLKIKSQNALA
jgi:hypothetical protein